MPGEPDVGDGHPLDGPIGGHGAKRRGLDRTARAVAGALLVIAGVDTYRR